MAYSLEENINKKKIRKWLATAISVVLVVSLYNGWILLPGFYVESYYRFDAPDGYEIENDYYGVREVTLGQGEKIRFFARCHKYGFQDFSQLISDQCTIKIFVDAGSKLNFSDQAKFSVEDTSWWKEPTSVAILVEVSGTGLGPKLAKIDFTSASHPTNIRLYIPPLKIEGESVNVPVLTGNFVKNVNFDWCTIFPCF